MKGRLNIQPSVVGAIERGIIFALLSELHGLGDGFDVRQIPPRYRGAGGRDTTLREQKL